MGKHTPGPWKTQRTNVPVYDAAGHLCDERIGIHGNGIYVASVGTCRKSQAERTLADSALIAAAPDLLEACQLAITKLDALRERFRDNWPIDLSPKVAETHIRAAIARATNG